MGGDNGNNEADKKGETSKKMLEETLQIPGTSTMHIDRFSIKIPPFWSDKPHLWFHNLEAQFKLNNITSEDTKFYYLVSQPEKDFIENIMDIITDQEPNKYTRAKQRLLSIFGDSEETQLKKLFNQIELGDQKPSILLQKMRILAGTQIGDSALKTMWLDKLPDTVKDILVISQENLDNLAKMADKILDNRNYKISEIRDHNTNQRRARFRIDSELILN
jgi:hypothetical protein